MYRETVDAGVQFWQGTDDFFNTPLYVGRDVRTESLIFLRQP